MTIGIGYFGGKGDNEKAFDKSKYKNDYQPCESPDSTMLGATQWAWLEGVFKKQADLRIIASSNQFSHKYNGWESWTNLPHERQKMTDLIKSTKANGVVFLSGDVHWGELSVLKIDGNYPLYDITSSGITQTWDKPEPNMNRIGKVIMQNNYGMIEIDWEREDPELTFFLKDVKGKERVRYSVNLSQLQF